MDPSGEIVTAGSMDPFHIYDWNLQTRKLLDVLTRHSLATCLVIPIKAMVVFWQVPLGVGM
jgi:hypothetical protein